MISILGSSFFIFYTNIYGKFRMQTQLFAPLIANFLKVSYSCNFKIIFFEVEHVTGNSEVYSVAAVNYRFVKVEIKYQLVDDRVSEICYIILRHQY